MSKTEPESARDMWWAQEQAGKGGVEVRRENADGPKENGRLARRKWVVYPSRYTDHVYINTLVYRYTDVTSSKSYSTVGELADSQSMTFEEFRDSEWWEPYLQQIEGCNCDSSWMDSCEVDCSTGYASIAFDKPDYRTVWWCSAPVPTGETTHYAIRVCKDGTVNVARGEQEIACVIDDIVEAIELADRVRESGVSIAGDGTITIAREQN